jgi:hypothetical protein
MSTSPIGTRVPTLAPNAIIRAGIPLSDNFNATDVAVSLGSLLDSGVYTPTVSGVVNGIAVTPNTATFIKIGSIVNCYIQLGVIMAKFQKTGSFELSLPVASNFTSTKNCFGLMQWSNNGILSEIVQLTINGEITNNTCFVSLSTNTAGLTMTYCTLTFQYQIL